jgi:multiple sugar transport system substrate-binding protein
MSTYGLFRYRAIQEGGAGDDLAWAPPPTFEPNGKMAVYGFEVAVNANSPQTEAAWQFVKFIGGPEGQSIMAEGGEVVARASAYKAAYFNSPDAQRQKEWSELVRNRGRLLTYSIATSTFHQVLGDAVARMILQGSTPEQAYDEIKKNYENKVSSLN